MYIRNEKQNRFFIEKLYEQHGEESPNVEKCYPNEVHSGIPGIGRNWGIQENYMTVLQVFT